MAFEVTSRHVSPYAATTLIVVTFPDGHQVVGSGAVVGPNDILTAAHVIYNPDHGGRASAITVYPGADFNAVTGQIENFSYKLEGGVPITHEWFGNAFADGSHTSFRDSESQYDVAVVGLSTPIGAQTGWFKLASGYDSPQWASIAGYASGMTGLMAGKVWAVRETSSSIYVATDKAGNDLLGPGSSGSPLYAVGVDGDPYLIGVKSAGSVSTNIWADIGLLYDQITAEIERNDNLLTGAYLYKPIADVDATAGRAFTFAFGADTFKTGNATGPFTYTASQADGTSLPAWLRFDAATRSFSGTPASASDATLNVRVSARSTDSSSASEEFSITIGRAGMQYTGTVAGERIVAQTGNDLIDGGDGLDTVVFSGNRSLYQVKCTAASSLAIKHVSGDGGADSLGNIERLQFADVSLAFDMDGNAGKAYRLYQAAFDRSPDQPGLGFWINALDTGHGMKSVASGFIGSDEFKTLYGSTPTNVELLTRLYQNVLHRAPDQDGFNWWLDAMNRGIATPVQTLIDFSESAENKAQVIGSIQGGIEYQLFG